MNYQAYLNHLHAQLTAQGFAAVALPADLTGRFAAAFERKEAWGRLMLIVTGQVNLTAAEEQQGAVSAATAWVQNQLSGLPKGCQAILLFPFDRRVSEAESAAITGLRQDGRERRWAVIPWVADLEVELLDRHSGFPPVDTPFVRALTDVPRGAVEELVRRSTGPRIGRPRLMISLDVVPATRLIMATTVAYYLWTLLVGGGGALLGGPGSQSLITWGANYGLLVAEQGQQWRLLTYILLHGGLFHLGMNMWALWALGRHVELIFGTWRMLFIYLVAGVLGGIGSAFFRDGYALSVGASGSVLGLLGALIYWGRSFKNRPVNWHGLWGPVAINLLLGFFLPFIDNQAHIGGFVGGFLAAMLAGAPGERSQPWRLYAMGAVGGVLLLILGGVVRLSAFFG